MKKSLPAIAKTKKNEFAGLATFANIDLSTLSPDQIKALSKEAIKNKLVKRVEIQIDYAQIDLESEIEIFLDNSGRNNSAHTRRAYVFSLNLLAIHCAQKQIFLPALNTREADNFCYAMAGERSPASVRRDIAGCSAFFSFLERRYDFVRNPFRGTRARPKHKSVRKGVYPDRKDIDVLIKNAPSKKLKIAIMIMAFRGLRVGALPELIMQGDNFESFSKGKTVKGTMPENVMTEINKTNFGKKIFSDMSETRIADQFKYLTKKLFSKEKISDTFSVHDLRHYYAMTQYQKDKDIYKLSKLLNHASINVTEKYLKGLNILL